MKGGSVCSLADRLKVYIMLRISGGKPVKVYLADMIVACLEICIAVSGWSEASGVAEMGMQSEGNVLFRRITSRRRRKRMPSRIYIVFCLLS